MSTDEAVRLTREQIEEIRAKAIELRPEHDIGGFHWWRDVEVLCDLALMALRSDRDAIIEEPNRGARTIGPHGGLKQHMPNPSEADLSDPLFEAIWQATKTWDVNSPEHYVGYCGMNGSHVMLILEAIRKTPKEPTDDTP